MSQPKSTLEKLNSIINGWETLAPDKSFGGMTLAQFKAAVKPSFDTREELRALESQVQSKQIERDNADDESLRLVQRVVNGVIGDPTEGPDSDLYDAFGYTRKSERKTGLTRKKKTGPGTGTSK
ncbi:MAG: hypothetical protein QOJ70_2184 [Acidobacteriota bacterium]|jgi:hypothetical protein|nr:hypothetical protein [Acidobacteriota bacterium]MDT7808371.1 hypothetical protein [Acidobacteriota bacterium]